MSTIVAAMFLIVESLVSVIVTLLEAIFTRQEIES